MVNELLSFLHQCFKLLVADDLKKYIYILQNGGILRRSVIKQQLKRFCSSFCPVERVQCSSAASSSSSLVIHVRCCHQLTD